MTIVDGALNARWDSTNIGFNGAGLRIAGGSGAYRVRWSQGPDELVSLDSDDDGDGMFDSAKPFHSFGTDGTYDIAVFDQMAGGPPVRLKAFMYANHDAPSVLGGTGLDDIMITGIGGDELRGASGNDWLVSGDGDDRIFGQTGNDVLLAGTGNDYAYGGTGIDLLSGDEGDDVLHGNDDTDYVYGDGGADTLYGDDGDDYLDGGAGVDRLFGGAGADTFGINPSRAPDGTISIVPDPDRDSIMDFQQGTDHIDLYAWGPLDFIGGAQFSGNGPEVRAVASGSRTIIFGDFDGDAVADFSVRVVGNYTLTSTDFYLASTQYQASPHLAPTDLAVVI